MSASILPTLNATEPVNYLPVLLIDRRGRNRPAVALRSRSARCPTLRASFSLRRITASAETAMPTARTPTTAISA